MQQAGQQLTQAAQLTGQITASPTPVNDAALQAAQAAAQNGEQAKAGAQQGAQDIAAILAALAQAQAGLTAQSGNGPMPGQPGQQGPPHQGNHPGNQPGGHPGQEPGRSGSKAAQNYQPTGEGAVQKGTRPTSAKPANFARLPARERAAIEQAQSEKYPEEYGPLVEQYLRNLASESSGAAK
jgi:hypothetical protein